MAVLKTLNVDPRLTAPNPTSVLATVTVPASLRIVIAPAELNVLLLIVKPPSVVAPNAVALPNSKLP